MQIPSVISSPKRTMIYYNNFPVWRKVFGILLTLFLIFINIFIPVSAKENEDTELADDMCDSGNHQSNRATRIGDIFSITELNTYEGDMETKKFLSGQIMIVKCKVTHPDSYENITGANISIMRLSDNVMVLSPIPMEIINDQTGSNWIWFRYSYYLSIPTPRGMYEIKIEAMTNSLSGQPIFTTINKTIEIKILNDYPRIKGKIGPIHKFEDDTDWVLNLSENKSDLEDLKSDLIWHIENINESLLKVKIDNDNISFHLIPNASGNNQLTLILEDSDKSSSFIKFWINVSSVNDQPVLISRIPNQLRPEDSPPWTINLTYYGYDLEDTQANKLLNWSVSDVNESLLNIKFTKNSTSNLMVIHLTEDAYGSNLVTLCVTDSDGGIAEQQIWINITQENDAPIWKDIPKILIKNTEVVNAIRILDYVLDLDTPLEHLILKIKSTTPNFIQCTINSQSYLNINITNIFYTGPGKIELSAFDGVNEVTTTMNVKIFLAKFTVHLLAPQNTSIVTTTIPYLHWSLENPSGLEPIYFDVYLDKEENKTNVLNRENASRKAEQKETWYGGIFKLENDQIYYWTVVPIYFDENGDEYVGKPTELIRNFRISTTAKNQPPFAVTVSPFEGESVKNQTVNLTWLGYDPDNDGPISYELYFSVERETVLNHNPEVRIELKNQSQNYFIISDLKEDEIYYWTVIPIVGEFRGKCLSSVSSFGINLINELPKTILILPRDKILVPKSPILYWDFIDPDPYEEIYFDIFLSDDKPRIENLDKQTKIATVKKISNYYLPSLENNKEYYWTVIGYDKGGVGTCQCGVWSFIISRNQTNHPPTTLLISPDDQNIIYLDKVKLTWNGSDPDNDKITYTVYFGDNFEAISNLEKNYLYSVLNATEINLENLEHNKQYYWTVIPDDSKVPGVCLDRIWSFKVDLEGPLKVGDEDDSNRIWITYQYVGLLIVSIIILGAIILTIKRRRFESRMKKYLKTGTKSHLPKDLKEDLISHRTLRAIHAGESDLTGDDLIEKEELVSHADYRDRPELRSRPYIEGEYEHDVSKSRYRSQTKLASHVKHAIPYAEAPKRGSHIQAKLEIELAKPLSKRISTDAPLKASSLPITKECPRCGSFKVKTYKDDTSRCLDCKFKF